ncbi:hypothetical protein N7539_001624 [Penicillium diatomitis]|uniref:Uncharacterized protein n=1 Tax=Penicillium diatomitis TaxID=2819901 RepID=A0A9X0BZX5_9EURO|nr:uncharacterized protein N7539_001624 [Penicillium diatomitis]KAJ5492878.1 hypothetical protein N7539_001624 [Penicillium diatomitis]
MVAPSYSSAARAGGKPATETTPNFEDPNFDPAEFLNETLSPLAVTSPQGSAVRPQGSVPLTELSVQLQALLSQISAQNVRLSSTLSQLSDEILRGGGRLAYEVELLRGETIGLSETLSETLDQDIAKFVPESTADTQSRVTGTVHQETPKEPTEEAPSAVEGDEGEGAAERAVLPTIHEPEYIANLRTLNSVRARLEDVVQTFGDAMEWPLPPSEISFSSSFISVSGPELGAEGSDQEEKGQEVMRKIRAEITGLLDRDEGGREGLEAASRRLEALRQLAVVWKGSAEEKARQRFVDALGRIVDERRRNLDHKQAMAEQSQRAPRSRMEPPRDNDSGATGGGLFRNLQRLREEIYLD